MHKGRLVTTLTRSLTVIALAASMVVGTSAAPASAAYPVCNTGYLYTREWPGLRLSWLLPSAGTNIFCQLHEGVFNNGAVTILQMHLNKCYNQNIAEDGDYGAATRRAVANAQTWERVVRGRNVATDGVYGPQTLTAMHFISSLGGSCIRIDGTINRR